MCTTGDTAHIDTIFKLLPHTRQRVWQQLEYRIDVCHVTRGARNEHLQLSRKNFFNFPVAVKNSIKVSPLVFLL